MTLALQTAAENTSRIIRDSHYQSILDDLIEITGDVDLDQQPDVIKYVLNTRDYGADALKSFGDKVGRIKIEDDITLDEYDALMKENGLPMFPSLPDHVITLIADNVDIEDYKNAYFMNVSDWRNSVGEIVEIKF